MKQYSVYVDVTMSVTVYVEADNEEQASSKVRDMITKDPYELARKADSYVGYSIESVQEE